MLLLPGRRFSALPKSLCRSGGIGRRAWFRSMYPQGCGGSSPFFGTKTRLFATATWFRNAFLTFTNFLCRFYKFFRSPTISMMDGFYCTYGDHSGDLRYCRRVHVVLPSRPDPRLQRTPNEIAVGVEVKPERGIGGFLVLVPLAACIPAMPANLSRP